MKPVFTDETIDRIQKGDEFSWKQILEIVPRWQGSHEIRLHALAFADALQQTLDKAGKPCTVQSIRNGRVVRVLTDSEALVCNKDRFHRRQEGLFRDNHRMRCIDRSRLDADDRRRLDQAIIYQSRVTAAIYNLKPTLKPEPARRSLPGIGPSFGEEVNRAV